MAVGFVQGVYCRGWCVTGLVLSSATSEGFIRRAANVSFRPERAKICQNEVQTLAFCVFNITLKTRGVEGFLLSAVRVHV